jgi:trk system potassium uptake protein TrkA
MRFIIVGCGRAGAELAWRLSRSGHDVTVIDEQAASFQNLKPDFRGQALQGDVLSREVLERSGVDRADGLAAVTNSDAVNAVAAHVARTAYGVRNVVVRNYATGWLRVHEAFGFQVVSSTSWGASRIEALLEGGAVRPVYSAGNGEVQVYELSVPEAWIGRDVCELFPDQPLRAVALTRAGRAVLPAPGLCLERGDVLLLSATAAGLDALQGRLTEPTCS